MNLKYLIDRLFYKQKGRCCYCDCQCILHCRNKSDMHNRFNVPNMATIEHKYPKTDIRRYIAPNEDSSYAMACKSCNGILGKHPQNLSYPFLRENEYSDTLFKDLLNGIYDNQFII